jgi:hypothetical protein
MGYMEMDETSRDIAAQGASIKKEALSPTHMVGGRNGRSQAGPGIDTQSSQLRNWLGQQKELVLSTQNISLDRQLQSLKMRKDAVPQVMAGASTNEMQVLGRTLELLGKSCQDEISRAKEKRRRYRNAQDKAWQEVKNEYASLRQAMRRSKNMRGGEGQ